MTIYHGFLQHQPPRPGRRRGVHLRGDQQVNKALVPEACPSVLNRSVSSVIKVLIILFDLKLLFNRAGAANTAASLTVEFPPSVDAGQVSALRMMLTLTHVTPRWRSSGPGIRGRSPSFVKVTKVTHLVWSNDAWQGLRRYGVTFRIDIFSENCTVTSYICRNGSRGTSQTNHYLVAQWQPNWEASDEQEF